MAENDIYKSKENYERLVKNLDTWVEKPKKGGRSIFYCKNPNNLQYVRKLIKQFETKDLSYIRRVRLLCFIKSILYATEKDLSKCEREDIDEIVSFLHTRNKTVESKKSFLKDLKAVWRVLFPELDRHGREDETITPYVVRHISRRVDKSKEKMRNERYTMEEFEKILKYFDNKPKVQCFLTAVHETYTRPQELLYLRMGNIEFYDNYGIAYISDHGKEGTKPIQFETLSYPYLLKWYQQHPLKSDPNAFLFICESNSVRFQQMTPKSINFHLRQACKDLGINKKITCYSLKRMGITIDRMNGVPDNIIIAKAGWVDGKQLSCYDLGTRKEKLRMSLIRKGLVKPQDEKEQKFVPKQKQCTFCQTLNTHTEKLCLSCKRPLDREKIRAQAERMRSFENNDVFAKLEKMEKLYAQLVNQ